jgi:hypothetical protein
VEGLISCVPSFLLVSYTLTVGNGFFLVLFFGFQPQVTPPPPQLFIPKALD